MDLKTAANFFGRTLVAGWNGTAWVPDVTQVTLLPFDRFISERDFGNKRRHILVDPDDTALGTYPVIKFVQTDDVYLVGTENHDILADEYSRIVLLHRAPFFGQLYEFTTTTTASGMPSAPVRSLVGNYWCDVERVTLSNSPQFEGVSLTQDTVNLPRNCPADTDHELLADGRYLDIKEVYKASGFIQCRALSKRSA